VLRELKKQEGVLEAVNTSLLRTLHPAEVAWDLERAGEAEAEMDEMWSFVGHKGNPRWLWHAIDHHTGKVLAYVFGRRTAICLLYSAPIKVLSLSGACGNHGCFGFVKARPVVSMSARRSFRR